MRESECFRISLRALARLLMRRDVLSMDEQEEGGLTPVDGYSPLRVTLPGTGQLSGRVSSRVQW